MHAEEDGRAEGRTNGRIDGWTGEPPKVVDSYVIFSLNDTLIRVDRNPHCVIFGFSAGLDS